MNRLKLSSKPRKFVVSSDSVMALLLVVSLWQIAMCVSASLTVIEPSVPTGAIYQVTAWKTNAPLLHDGVSQGREKSSGFPLVANPS